MEPGIKWLCGCEEPTQMAVWEDDDDEFYNCPLRFITDQTAEWYKEYAYYQDFPGAAPAYRQMPAKFLEAISYYKGALADQAAKRRPAGQRDNTRDARMIWRNRQSR